MDLSKYHSIVFDFDGVFTDNFLFMDENGVESVRVSRSDGYAIDMLRKYCEISQLKISLLILSTEKNKVVTARAKKLGLECISGQSDKLKVLLHRFESQRPHDREPMSGVVYFGNDLNDLPIMLKSGFTFCPQDAHPRIKEIANRVICRPGGQEFVREGVEFLLGIEALSMEELNEFISDRGSWHKS